MAGFGVSPGDLTKTAGVYESEGSAITGMKAQAVPGVGPGQVGRKFKGTADTAYKAAFDRLGANLDVYGRECTQIAQRLKDVAKSYESNEAQTSGQFKG